MSIVSRLEPALLTANQWLTVHAKRNRKAYALIAAALFIGGTVVSALALDLKWHHFDLPWLVLNLLIGAPVALALNAVGLQISAQIVGAELSFQDAFRTCCIAFCSNLLPIPAGTMIQASSLVSRGAAAVQSGIVVLAGNGLSLSIITVIGGIALIAATVTGGTFAILVGISGITAGTLLILHRTDVRTAVSFLAIRLLRVLVTIVRVQVSFLIVGLAVSALDSALFSGAIILGSIPAVFPAGLGLSESIAAGLALATTVSSGAAFLAIALNRLAMLVFAGTYILIESLINGCRETNA